MNIGIGEDLRLRRTIFGLRQWEVAARVGIPQSTLSLLESGIQVPSPEMAERVRRAIEEIAKEKGGVTCTENLGS